MQRAAFLVIVILLGVSLGPGLTACAYAGMTDETIASVNGEKISVRELREAIGIWGGKVSASALSTEKKTEALERLIDGRLLAQDARSRGLDNTEDFRDLLKKNEPRMLISALFRKEVAIKMKVTKEAIGVEAGKLRKADKNLNGNDVLIRAKAAVWEKNRKRVEEELIETAKKEAGVSIDDEMLDKIGKGELPSDNAILASSSGEKITYGEVRDSLRKIMGGKHGGQDFTRSPVPIRNYLNRATTERALDAYARKQGIGESDWMAIVRQESERTILVNMLTETRILNDVRVTDKEIAAAYAKHSTMLVRDGKKIPLEEIKSQIKGVVLIEKRKKAFDGYVARLKKKAKITIRKKMLPKV
jgi:hypothetical protein